MQVEARRLFKKKTIGDIYWYLTDLYAQCDVCRKTF